MAFGSNITRTRIRSNGTVTKTRKKTTTKSKWGMKGEKTFKPRNGGDSQVSDGGSGLSGDLADVDAGPGTGRLPRAPPCVHWRQSSGGSARPTG